MYIVLCRSMGLNAAQLQVAPVGIFPILRVVVACCNVAVKFRENADKRPWYRDKAMIQTWHCVCSATLWPFFTYCTEHVFSVPELLLGSNNIKQHLPLSLPSDEQLPSDSHTSVAAEEA